jgi:hypothetical protein
VRRINYDAADMLHQYKAASEVPRDVLVALNLFSEDPETQDENLEWLEENFEALRAGYRSTKEWEEDMMSMMYPEGYDPDSDGGVSNDE